MFPQRERERERKEVKKRGRLEKIFLRLPGKRRLVKIIFEAMTLEKSLESLDTRVYKFT